MRMHRGRRWIRTLWGYLAILCFVVVIGTVGAAEQSTMPLLSAGIAGFALIGLTTLFAWLAGWIG